MNDTRRRVIIATDASVNLQSGFAERYQVLIVPRRFRLGNKVVVSGEGPTQFASERRLPVLLPAHLDDFISGYKQAGSPCIVSIHSPSTLDNAIHQVKIARNLLTPGLDIELFEAKTLDGGVQFLVETAAAFVESVSDATKDQVLALLERIQGEMISLVLARWTGNLPCAPGVDSLQQLASQFGARLLLKMENARGTFTPLAPGKRSSQVAFADSQQVMVQWRRQDARQANRLYAEMVAQLGADAFQVREIYLKNPHYPDDFIGIVAFPDATRINELVKWVKRWG